MAIPSQEDCRLVIQSFPDDLDERWVSNTLSKYGPITGIEIPLRRNGKRKGFAYIQFTNTEHLKACIAELNGMRLNNRILGALSYPEFQSRNIKVKNKLYLEELVDETKHSEKIELEPPAYVKIPRRDVQIVKIPRPKTPPTPPPSPPPKPPPAELVRVVQDALSPIIPPQQPLILQEGAQNSFDRDDESRLELDRNSRFEREGRGSRYDDRDRRRDKYYDRGRDSDLYKDRELERRHRRKDRDRDEDRERRSHRHRRHRDYD